jgi:hypothetical protein
MAIYTIYLDTSDEYKQLANDMFKYLTILFVFHFLMTISYGRKGFARFGGFGGDFLNSDFINIFVFFMLSIATYHLVVKNIIVFV